MSVTSYKSMPSSLRKAAAATAVATVAATLMAAPAVASPQGDIFNMLNAAHQAAGCAAYGSADALGNVALVYVKNMVEYDGKTWQPGMSFRPSTKDLIENNGYTTGGWGELDYFHGNGGGSAQNAVDFWKNNQVWGLIKECGLSDLGVAVWYNGNKWAASAILGQPVAPEPQVVPNVH